jgi:preprotein translocase subunit SecG
MYTFFVILHIVACLFLIGVVLLQQGKGAEMGAVFGGSSSTIFGSSGAGNFLTRLTTGFAVVFMLTSLVLTYSSARRMSATVFDSGSLPEPPPLEAPLNQEGQPPAGAAPGAQGSGDVQPQAAQPQGGAPAPAAAPAPQAAAPEAAPQAPSNQ